MNTKSATVEHRTDETAPPRGVAISGKRMTVGLLGVLLVSGLLFYWVTTAYATYNAARRQSDQAWREVAALLEPRYRLLDKSIATGVDSRQLDMRLGEQWRSTRDAFSGTSLTSHQVEAALRLEKMIGQLPETDRVAAVISEELLQASDNYQKAITLQRQIGNTAGSRLLKSMLILPDPTDFLLSKSSS